MFIGQRRWCDVLASELQSRFGGSSESYSSVGLTAPTDVLRIRSIRDLLSADIIVRVGFRPAAPTPFGRLFSLAWRGLLALRPDTQVVWYWIGTDVLETVRTVTSTQRRARVSREVSRGRHLAGSDSLSAELATIGISADVAWFPALTLRVPVEPPPLPETYTVLTYIPDARPDFYGARDVLELARRMPDIDVLVAGGAGSWTSNPPENLEFLGWIDDMSGAYARSSCVLRLVEHDSLGATAIEGLLFGRDVVYSGPLMHAATVRFGDVDELVATVGRLRDGRQGNVAASREIAEWARATFDQDARLRALRVAVSVHS